MALEDTTDMTPAASSGSDRGDDFTPTPEAVAEAAQLGATALAASKSEPQSTLDDDADLELAKGSAKPAAEAKAEPEPTRDDKGRFIPKGRFDEAVGREREAREAAERKVAELQAQMAQVSKNADQGVLEEEIQDLERQHAKQSLDGDHETAAKTMTQIRLKERTIALAQASEMSNQARAQAAEEVRMDMAIASLETTYDVLNPSHESFDQDAVDMVLDMQRRLIERDRMPPSQALTTATQKIMAKLMPSSKQDEPPPKVGLAAADVGKDRAQAQVTKNIATAKAQPASLKESGIDSDRAGMTTEVADPTKLSFDEFNALPAATKARMRGDMV